jgi:hypothetical protein
VIEKIKGKIKWVSSTDFLAVLTLFVSSIFFFYDLLNGRYLLTERDLGPYFIPPRFFWVESIKNGEFPLWNPYQFSGHPFFANPQHAILYPLNGLFFLLPFDVAFNAIIILHFFLGGLFTYLLLRDLKVGSTGSLISGLIFMLSGYLLSVHSLLNCLLSVIWTPLIMMFFRRSVLHPGFKNEILTAVFISFSFLGGGIEIVYGNFWVLLVMVIFSPQLNPSSPPSVSSRADFTKGGLGGLWRVVRRVRSLVIVCVFFLFLSAIQLIPFLELWIHSIRGNGISYQEATIWSFAPKDILLFFLPDAYGYFLDMKRYWVTQCWLKTLYTGGLPFILSAFFFFSPQSPLSSMGERGGMRGFGKGRGFYLSLILLSLFLSLGQYNPLYPFVHKYVPFFNGIRYPVKFLYIFILVLSVTAGLGFQKLTDFSGESGPKRLKNLFILSSLASVLLLLCLILGHKEVEHFLKLRGVDFPDFGYLSVNLFHTKRFLFYLALFFLLLRVGREVQWKPWAKVLLIFFLIADLFGNMGFYVKEKTPPDYFRKTRILEIISSDLNRFRVFSTAKTISQDIPILVGHATYIDYLKEKHLPTMNLLYRLHDVWGIDVIHLKRIEDLYRALIGTPSISSTNLMDLYGVKYVISVTPIEKDPRFELIYVRLEGLRGKKEDLLKENTIKLYRNKNTLPRGWLVKDFRVLDSNEILWKLNSREFHPDGVVLLEEEPLEQKNKVGDQTGPPLRSTNAPSPPFTEVGTTRNRGALGGLVQFVSESNNRLKLGVRAAENSFLVLSDTYFPGIKAYVNGKEEKIYRANYAFRAIPLTAGTHEVEFIYDPLSFKVGTIITFLAIISLIGIGWFQRRRGAPRWGSKGKKI